jgi:hypothetical protein
VLRAPRSPDEGHGQVTTLGGHRRGPAAAAIEASARCSRATAANFFGLHLTDLEDPEMLILIDLFNNSPTSWII